MKHIAPMYAIIGNMLKTMLKTKPKRSPTIQQQKLARAIKNHLHTGMKTTKGNLLKSVQNIAQPQRLTVLAERLPHQILSYIFA